MEEKYNLYDNVLAKTFEKIAKTYRGNEQIEIYYNDTEECKVVLKVVEMISAICTQDIILYQNKIIPFLIYKIKFRKRKNLKIKFNKQAPSYNETNLLARDVLDELKLTSDIYNEIWTEYYAITK